MAETKRYSNPFSKLIEKEREKHNGDESRKSDATNLLTSNGLPLPSGKIGVQSGLSGNGDVQSGDNQAKSWNWSEPPGFSQDLDRKGFDENVKLESPVESVFIGTPVSTDKPTTNLPSNQLSNNGFVVQDNYAAAPTSQKRFQLPAFRTIEINPEAVEPHLVAITQPRSVHCEEFRGLRTHILHRAERQRMQAVVVASSRPGEGKTTTAVNLAWLMAQTDGITALLIDSDLRMPSLADYLGVSEKPGLSEVFSGESKLEDAIIRLEPAGLHLLPGGEPRDDVAEMLSGSRFREILEQARLMFDFIIIDAPPLGIFTDAAVLINHADGALLVVRAGKTRYNTVNRLLEDLPRDRMLGVVLNGGEGEVSADHYDYYYNNYEKKQ
ncbi:MAG: CpsD/CapB family tyrosine-protein kinase [Pyrinomonadaceae bacterium]|nr:CpsD/CapB family tyrosine-protein kinase [Pyrinomonadaceae bacterium]